MRRRIGNFVLFCRRGVIGTKDCDHLSHRSKSGVRDSDVHGRGSLVSSCTARENFHVIRRCISSKCSNAGFSHPHFRGVVRSIGGKGVGYVVIGSLSHLKQGCVRANQCLRGVFPFLGIHFVTVGSRCSDTSRAKSTSRVMVPFGGLVGSTCYHSVSVGVEDRLSMGEGGKGFVNDFTTCNCLGSPTSGGRLIVSRMTTRVIEAVFNLGVGNFDSKQVTSHLSRVGMTPPLRCGEVYNFGFGDNFHSNEGPG